MALREFEHTPLAQIQGWSEVPRGQPLFGTLFNFQDPAWDATLKAQGGKWAKREFATRSQPNYPLALDAASGPALLVKILYQRNRFDHATIARMLGHLETLLEGMAANPNQRLGTMPLLSAAESHQLLVTWNKTEAEFPADKCIHQLFEEQVERTPHALAVADDEQQLTYHQLNERAGQLAHQLRELGAGPDVLVGVCMERSVEMVVALLSVLKAGAAYVPLDPAYPKERLVFMLKDAQAPVLLTRSSLHADFKSEIPNLKLLCVDSTAPALTDQALRAIHHDAPSPSASRTPHSNSLAYVTYTSGSTGTPKGVEIQHAGLVNLATWHQRLYSVTPADRATQ